MFYGCDPEKNNDGLTYVIIEVYLFQPQKLGHKISIMIQILRSNSF
jgi:hypothetical protein